MTVEQLKRGLSLQEEIDKLESLVSRIEDSEVGTSVELHTKNEHFRVRLNAEEFRYIRNSLLERHRAELFELNHKFSNL